jgi:GTP-binding protein HflX
METVSRLLQDLALSRLPVLLVFNKADLVARAFADQVVRRFEAVAVSALDPHSLDPLLERLEKALGRQKE